MPEWLILELALQMYIESWTSEEPDLGIGIVHGIVGEGRDAFFYDRD